MYLVLTVSKDRGGPGTLKRTLGAFGAADWLNRQKPSSESRKVD